MAYVHDPDGYLVEFVQQDGVRPGVVDPAEVAQDGDVVSILASYCIYVSDMDNSVEFWRDVIGIEYQFSTDLGQIKEVVLQSPHGGSRIQLAQKLDDDSPIDMGNAMWKLYVNTSDCKDLYDRAIAAGATSVMEPARLDRWPVTMAFVQDRDGYLVEFVEYHDGTNPGVPDPKELAATS